MAKNNQKIKCNVESCKYNEESKECSLKEIMVSEMKSAEEKSDTICDSYDKEEN